MKINLGCGAQVVEGWVNVDYALGAKIAKVPAFRVVNSRLHLFNLNWDDRIFLHDLTTRFPWQDSTVEAAYSSHTLEHMSRDDGRRFVSECFRVLRPGAVLRIVIPDLRAVVDRYLTGELVAEHFVEELGVLYESSGSSIKTRLAPLMQYPHKCMYDVQALERLLGSVGFDARACAPFDSRIQNIKDIEIAGRTEQAVIVEGIKPLSG